MNVRTILALLGAGAALSVVGCDRGPEEQRALDLLALYPTAEERVEKDMLDFGTPAARPHLQEGWSYNQTAGEQTLVWAVGREASLRLYSTLEREVEATLLLSPYEDPERPAQRIEVEVNGRGVAEWTLPPGFSEQTAPLPLVAGDNSVVFRFAHHRRPRVGGDRRRLAAAFDSMRFGRPAADRPRREGERLYVPYGSEVGFHADLRSGARLSLGEVEHRGEAEGALEIVWREEGGGERRELWDGESRLPSPTGPDFRPVRLALRATSPSATGRGWEGVVVTAPRLHLASPPPAGSGVESSASGPTLEPPPNVLLYVIDTLRADRLGCYGQERPLTPALDALAAEGVLFERAVAQTSWTRPAVASILTGLGPLRHGVNGLEDALPDEAVTLAELFAAAGYRTAAFVANDHITRLTGFDQGFEHFELLRERSAVISERVLEWLDGGDAGNEAPLFLYVHAIDPHAPYAPETDWRERFAPGVEDPAFGSVAQIRALGERTIEATPETTAALLQLYDAEVAQNDAAFGSLREGLERRGLSSAIVVLSDHGEAFDEHGVFGHGWDLYAETLDVPLIVHLPDGPRGLRVAQTVQHVDLFPTFVELFGLEAAGIATGRSLVPLLAGRSVEETPVVSYLDYAGRQGISVIEEGWKLVEPLNARFGSHRELYRQGSEGVDLAASRPVTAGLLASRARAELRHLGSGLRAATAEVDAETRRQLEALGYVP